MIGKTCHCIFSILYVESKEKLSKKLMSYSFTNLEILEILELSYQFIMFFAEMFRKMPETVLYALMPNVTRFFFINNIINQKYLVSGILPNISAKNIIN